MTTRYSIKLQGNRITTFDANGQQEEVTELASSEEAAYAFENVIQLAQIMRLFGYTIYVNKARNVVEYRSPAKEGLKILQSRRHLYRKRRRT